ncbi:unnamed protein product [Adineta steineri]|uniref:DZIP3-like HEPN domain-containing protein n=2 Tax=Adineta steineri TaxID=433720 RepID=A0A814Z907_9BILA|nr:unnamed protein product [Adineta steineri]
MPPQKKTVGNGDTNEWDVSTLTAILLFSDRPQTLNTNETQKLDQEDSLIKQLKDLRNDLAHNSSKSIGNIEFNQLWNKLSTILVTFGDIDTELDKLKDDSVFESPEQTINEENKNEALRLNSLGTQAHKDGKYSKAIKFFIQATVLSSVSNHDRATFFSNMAASRVSLYKQNFYTVDNCEDGDITKELDRALKDAKQARKLWVTWWKAHFRVGQVYAILGYHDKAINSFERALALDPTKSETQKALDESRIIVHRNARQEYLDPRANWKTIPENLNELKEKFGLDPEMVRQNRSLLELIDPSAADVMKGHQFVLGDIDVIQDYEQAAKYFAKAANAGNAEGMYNLARLFDKGLGVKKDHNVAREWLEKAATQPPEHPVIKGMPNIGVAESEHALGVRYFEGSLFNNGQIWIDSAVHGNNYLTNVISKNKKINLMPPQKKTVDNGNTNEWDISTLTAILLHSDRPQTLNTNEIQKLDQEDLLLEQLRLLRNKLAHNSSKSIGDIEFNQLWNDLSTILVAFGDIDTELDKLKDDSVFESPEQTINEENKNEALRLNSLGTQAHKDGKYSEAIKFFIQATVLSSVSNHDRATFFSNMAASRVSLYKQHLYTVDNCEDDDITKELDRALKDAKQARKLWVTWWKAHFRVGQVYAILVDHDKAINSFERALALDPNKSETQKALDESRIIVHRNSRQEYLDPRANWKTIPENLNELKEKFGLDPEMVRQNRSLLELIDPSAADVMKGHQFALGDIDVIQDYEQAAKYFAKAANAGNAEGMYNLARLFDKGLGVKKDHNVAREWLEKAATQPPEHPVIKGMPNIGVAESEHALGVRYFEGY